MSIVYVVLASDCAMIVPSVLRMNTTGIASLSVPVSGKSDRSFVDCADSVATKSETAGQVLRVRDHLLACQRHSARMAEIRYRVRANERGDGWVTSGQRACSTVGTSHVACGLQEEY
jgi:hypothetical protein